MQLFVLLAGDGEYADYHECHGYETKPSDCEDSESWSFGEC